MKREDAKVNAVKVGIAGLGTVGSGTVNVLQRNAGEIARRVGRPIEIAHIGARRDNPACDINQGTMSRSASMLPPSLVLSALTIVLTCPSIC